MKDAKGHGSDAHSGGVQQVGKQSVDLMSKSQIEQLRTQFAGIKTIDPSQPTYGKLTSFLSDTHPARLKQLADANIPFLSNLARNRLPKSGKVKVSVDPAKIGYRMADIGPGGKEHNVKTGGAWKS